MTDLFFVDSRFRGNDVKKVTRILSFIQLEKLFKPLTGLPLLGMTIEKEKIVLLLDK